VSVVSRPRDPLARISKVSFSQNRMRSMIGGREIPGEIHEMECYHCRQSCTGLWDSEVVHSLLARS
jgi:hypothetical protein